MATPGQSELLPALEQLHASERALLELCLRHHCSDDKVAEITGSTPSEVKWRRAELIIDIAGRTGHSDPAGLVAVGKALGGLPPSAWRETGRGASADSVDAGGERSAPLEPRLDESAAPVPVPLPAAEERTRPAPFGRRRRLWWRTAAGSLPAGRRAALAATVLLPALVLLYLSFSDGGFFVGEPATAALFVSVAVLLRVVFAKRPFEGFSVPLGLAAAALAVFTAWTLASSAWSGAPGRALVEFDRSLLYLLVLVLAGSLARTDGRMRLMLRGITLAIVAVCVSGFVTRVLPDLWPVEPNTADLGLNYPLTYSNAVGLLAALGIVFALHHASDAKEPGSVRVLSAAALPALAATLLLTLSRGAISVGVLGVLAYALLGRPRGLVTTFIATAPATTLSLVVTYKADRLHTQEYASGAALDQGHHVAWVVALCCIASLVLRALLLPVDKRLAPGELLRRLPRLPLAAAGATAATALVIGGLAAGAPSYVSKQYRLFLDKSSIPTDNPRARLASTSSNGRTEFWDVALDGFRREPLTGNGAGTYQLLWTRDRPRESPATDAHSVYVEVLAELGLVGLIALGGAIVLVLGRFASLARGPSRALYAALFTGGLVWAVLAGFDWHWEMPAVTLPFFALGGLALAASRPGVRAPRWMTRATVGLALVLIAVTPARVAVSQDRLDDSYDAFKDHRCDVVTERALASIDALGTRSEPFELLAYCEAGGPGGRARRAVQTMQHALERDPHNWELHYGLALVRGAARLDPRSAARAALRLNPRGFLPRTAVKSFSRARGPGAWARVAGQLQLPVH